MRNQHAVAAARLYCFILHTHTPLNCSFSIPAPPLLPECREAGSTAVGSRRQKHRMPPLERALSSPRPASKRLHWLGRSQIQMPKQPCDHASIIFRIGTLGASCLFPVTPGIRALVPGESTLAPEPQHVCSLCTLMSRADLPYRLSINCFAFSTIILLLDYCRTERDAQTNTMNGNS